MHGGFVGPGMLDAACPGRGVHLADARPDARGDQGRQRRRRRPAHRQELHRRRHELRHGGRHGQGRGHRGRDGPHQRRRRGGGLALHRGPARRRASPCSSRRSAARRPTTASRCGGGRAGPPGQRQRPLDGHGADPVHHARRRASPASSSPTTRWRSASASTASRAASARSIGPASQIAERLMTPILEDLPFSSGDKVLAFVNGMGGTPLIELYVVYAEVAQDRPGARAHDRAQPDRQLHHLAGDAGLLDHAAQARRRAWSATGTRP